MKDLIISIDLGTTSVKIALVNISGEIEAVTSREYPIILLENGGVEQVPLQWWKGILECFKELWDKKGHLRDRVLALSICGQMHTHVYLDKKDAVLGNAITWMDQRSSTIVSRWKSGEEGEILFEATSNFVTPTYAAPQIKWVMENKPEIYEKATSILIAKDYIKYLLTGKKVTDPSDASGTLLYDVVNNKWSEEAFKITGIRKELFAEVLPSTEIIGKIRKSASEVTGLPEGLPVINGGADHSVSEIGAGLLKEGLMATIIGTAGVVASCVSRPVKDVKKRVICWSYPIDGFWDVLGITQTAAAALTWFKNSFDSDSNEDIFEQYSCSASRIKAGSEGLIFLPYLVGERTPHWDSKARGILFGLSMKHSKEHIIRSIMEGVAYSLRECIEVMEELGLKAEQIRTMGGGSKSKVWRSIQANVYNKEIVSLKSQECSAIGNMILSGLTLGFFKDLNEASTVVKTLEIDKPNIVDNQIYEQRYNLYKKLYRTNKELFRELED